MGETGELVIGGVGLARYLDAEKDAEKFAPLPVAGLGARLPQRRPRPRRARPGCCSSAGPTSRSSSAGGGSSWARSTPRCQALPGVAGAAAAVRRTRAGNQVLVGYVVPAVEDRAGHRRRGARPCASSCPPRSCRCSRSSTTCRPARPARSTGTRCPGRCPSRRRLDPVAAGLLTATEGWLAESWAEILGVPGDRPEGRLLHPRRRQPRPPRSWWPGSAPATRRCRSTTSTSTRRCGALATRLDALGATTDRAPRRRADAAPRRGRAGAAHGPDAGAGRPALVERRRGDLDGRRRRVRLAAWAPTAPWWWLALAWLVLFSPAGRIAIAAGGARLLLRGVRPGSYPRGGAVHLRLWAADPARRAVRCDRRLERVVDSPATPARSARRSATTSTCTPRRR